MKINNNVSTTRMILGIAIGCGLMFLAGRLVGNLIGRVF